MDWWLVMVLSRNVNFDQTNIGVQHQNQHQTYILVLHTAIATHIIRYISTYKTVTTLVNLVYKLQISIPAIYWTINHIFCAVAMEINKCIVWNKRHNSMILLPFGTNAWVVDPFKSWNTLKKHLVQLKTLPWHLKWLNICLKNCFEYIYVRIWRKISKNHT